MMTAGRKIGGFMPPHVAAPVRAPAPIPAMPAHVAVAAPPNPVMLGHAGPQMGPRAQDSLGLIKQRILANSLRGGTASGHPSTVPTFGAAKVPGMIR